MTYSILIPLRNGNPDDKRGRIPWWAAAERSLDATLAAGDIIFEIVAEASRGGCSEVVLSQPHGSERGLRVESDQIRRLHGAHSSIVMSALAMCRELKVRTALFTGFGWPNRPWSPFRWRYGTVSRDGKWRYPNVDSSADRRAVFADLATAKAIGFDSVWIDQLSTVNGEVGRDNGSRWASAIGLNTGLRVVGEAHWDESPQYGTDMVSLGREVDDPLHPSSKPRHHKGVRDIVWINGHSNVYAPECAENRPVRTPADQVAAGRRYAAMGFEVCYEVDSVETMRGIVEARAGGGGGPTAIAAKVSATKEA